jgi:acyl-CoA thioester hydrolase
MTEVAAAEDTRRTDAASYPQLRSVTLKYSDVDPTGTVGTVAIARLFEEGRYLIRSTIDHPLARDPGVGFVLVRVRIDVLAAIHYPGTVDIAIGVGSIGRTSFGYVSALFQDGRCAALSDATVAVRDRKRGTGCALTPSFHATLASLRYGGAAG